MIDDSSKTQSVGIAKTAALFCLKVSIAITTTLFCLEKTNQDAFAFFCVFRVLLSFSKRTLHHASKDYRLVPLRRGRVTWPPPRRPAPGFF